MSEDRFEDLFMKRMEEKLKELMGDSYHDWFVQTSSEISLQCIVEKWRTKILRNLSTD